MTSTAELVRLSRTSIAEEMREQHHRRVLWKQSGNLAIFSAILRTSSR